MVAKRPDWHPDPEGGRQVRFWDGEQWTDYVQPLAPPRDRTFGPETATTDYPYLAEGNVGPAREPRVVDTWIPEPVRSPIAGQRRQRSALGWWIAAGAVALVLVVAGVVTALRTDPAPPLADPEPSATLTADAPVSAGASATVTIPTAGTGVVPLVVDTPGAYLLDVTAARGDVAARVTAGSALVWEGDDRGTALADLIGGTWSEPAAFLELEPGEYTVELTEHDDESTSATVSLSPVETESISTLAPVHLAIPADDYLVLRLDLDAPQDLTIDVRGVSSWDDPELVYFADGRAVAAGDRGPTLASDVGGSEYDPYVAAAFPAGTSFLVLSEYSGEAIEVTITVTPPTP